MSDNPNPEKLLKKNNDEPQASSRIEEEQKEVFEKEVEGLDEKKIEFSEYYVKRFTSRFSCSR